MKKKTKIVFVLIIAIIIIMAIIGIIIVKRNLNQKQEWNNEYSKVNKNEINYKEDANVNELKEVMGLTADSDLYEITEEYDGRKTLNIKTDILYKVVFAGIIKQSKPTLEEIDVIYSENHPVKDGVWVSQQSRDAFLELIKENTNSEYEINDEGYLIIKDNNNQNENDKKLEELINSNKKIIVDINDYDYDVDVVTGEIVEYPFEQLGEISDVISNNNDRIIVILKNKEQKFTEKEILEEFLNNI